MDDGNKISQNDIRNIYQSFYDQIILKFDKENLSDEEYQGIIENYKCVYNDLSDRNKIENIQKKEIQDSRLISHIQRELQK